MAFLGIASRRPCAQRSRRAPLRSALAALLLWSVAGWSTESAPPLEFQLKAVFLFHFAQFVDWPDQAFATPQSPLTICVLGEDPFDGFLDDTVKGEKINDHPFAVHRAQSLEEIGRCHILYFSNSDSARVKQDLAAVKGQSVLPVGDGDEFERSGGIIGFMLAENKIRLLVNPEAAKAANQKLSSKLLQAAQIVSSSGAQP